ncbi:xanthine dehydrogenase family protein molybdopterin-binding subunit [Acetobacter persici]|uniref:xanthine dehydrogenase family protein molybdopterin-binding subunit n=1 Tax=Acetobacter persici TaxID=1076596 RepID=UPI0020CE0401|nr:molybdopterin cofactor-binding domain-containing protein [Acetobacter persici]MCP9320553.1 xanthine dehydrogenase family protein molybdopterin-binding subunit [Acetobacter persici]
MTYKRPKTQSGLLPASRRALLGAAVKGGGGFLLSAFLPGLPLLQAARAQDTATGVIFRPNAFIRITPQGAVTFIMRYAEMGQGIYTGISMLLAEELGVTLDQVTVEAAPADPAYVDSVAGEEETGGSSSTRDSWVPLREAGAAARMMLVAAAAQIWGVPEAACQTRNGQVFHPDSGRSLSYGALAEAAARQLVPAKVVLKSPSDFSVIGTNPRRLDTKAKTNGSAQFGIDVQVPGMKIGRIMACPVKGGHLTGYDRTAALAVPGVVDVVTLPDALAVIGEHMWAAIKGLDAAAPQWDYGPNAATSSSDIIARMKAASDQSGVVALKTGNAEDALKQAHTRIDAVYELPFLAHAALEPINTTLHIRPDGADVWVGTQVPGRARQEVADATGLKPETIAVHNHLIGGGFGRRLDSNSIGQAARFAKQVPYPVKLIWTRKEDMTHDQFRPYYYDRVSAGLTRDGAISGWHHRTTGSAVTARWYPEGMQGGLDPDAVEGATQTPYNLPDHLVEFVRDEPAAVTTLWWRGVGPTHNVFVVESMIDELAHQAAQDPLAFRKTLAAHQPRALKVLNEVEKQSGWGKSLPSGHGMGVALHYSFQTWAATVLEVAVEADGQIRLIQAHSAVDCGPVVFPDGIVAQIQGGLIFGLTMALYNEITLKNGRVEQTNFHNYRMMRLNEAPDIQVHLVSDPGAEIGGIGEVGTVAAAPALANALFAATGKRLRRIPFARQMGGGKV